MSPWITYFWDWGCQVSILGADQTDRSLCGREWFVLFFLVRVFILNKISLLLTNPHYDWLVALCHTAFDKCMMPCKDGYDITLVYWIIFYDLENDHLVPQLEKLALTAERSSRISHWNNCRQQLTTAFDLSVDVFKIQRNRHLEQGSLIEVIPRLPGGAKRSRNVMTVSALGRVCWYLSSSSTKMSYAA